jgi:hypothetical protein
VFQRQHIPDLIDPHLIDVILDQIEHPLADFTFRPADAHRFRKLPENFHDAVLSSSLEESGRRLCSTACSSLICSSIPGIVVMRQRGVNLSQRQPELLCDLLTGQPLGYATG